MLNWGVGLGILETLHAMKSVEICKVVTRCPGDDEPDKWAGAVCRTALRLGYPVWDQELVAFDSLAGFLMENRVDVLVCHAYMRKLPPDVLNAPRIAAINVHGSLLPAYRGKAPHREALNNRETRTGLTCHFMDSGLDTGEIIYQAPVDIDPDETLGSLLDKLADQAPHLIEESFRRLLDPEFRPLPQDVGPGRARQEGIR